jgi:type IV secretory pathway VirB2 component (pilin)
MSDIERPSTGGAIKVIAIVAIVIVGWLVLLPVLSLARSLIPLALYVIIAVVAFQVGKVAGRKQD